MKKSSLLRMYDRLRAQERFQLTVEALARGDEQEAERLANTCPRKTYAMNDVAFSERFRASQLISSYVCAELIEVLGMLRTVEAYREAVETYEEVLFSSLERAAEEEALSFHQGWDAGCDHAWQAAGKRGPFPYNDKASLNDRAKQTVERIKSRRQSKAGDDSLASLEDVHQALSAQAQTVWEGFSRFCRKQPGLEPETMLRACFPVDLRLPGKLKEAVGSARVDPALLEDYEAMLGRTWHELVGN